MMALVLASQADESIRTAAGAKQGSGMVTAARVIAWIQLILVALLVVFGVALLVGLALGA